MLFWSELVEGGAVLRQQVFLNAGIIACREHGSKQGSIPIPNPLCHIIPAVANKPNTETFRKLSLFAYADSKLNLNLDRFSSRRLFHTETPSVPQRGHPIRSY